MDDVIMSSQAYWDTQPPPRGILPETEPVELSEPAQIDPTQNGQSSSSATFGMSTFNNADSREFGRSVRLSMALIEGKATSKPSSRTSIPRDANSIMKRLHILSQDISACQAEQLELLVRFDDLKGWEHSGAKHCAAWMNMELGISLQTGWEYLRAGRQLQDLPVTTALFRAGQLGWSKIRIITRVATKENESRLCHCALDASVSQVEQLCNEYRWQHAEDERQAENDRAMQQWEARSLYWHNASNGNVRISLSLPPETAQAFLNSVEHSLGRLESSSATMAQRRADAAALMAETSLQSAGREMATADRFQVIVSVDATELRKHHAGESNVSELEEPSKRAIVSGAASGTSPLAKDTVRRLACDCSMSSIITHKGEPVDIGRKTRIWPTAMTRAIKARDKTCVFPGCTHSQHLQIHHIEHWADGGKTSLDNGACLCSYHHTLVHEGGYRIERVAGNEELLEAQFKQQSTPKSLNTGAESPAVEQKLRHNRDSFNAMRSLSPERFRFRIVDSNGHDVVHQNHSPRGEWSTTSAERSGVAEPLAQYNVGTRIIALSASGAYSYGSDPRGLRLSPRRARNREHLDTSARRYPTGCTYMAPGRC